MDHLHTGSGPAEIGWLRVEPWLRARYPTGTINEDVEDYVLVVVNDRLPVPGHRSTATDVERR